MEKEVLTKKEKELKEDVLADALLETVPLEFMYALRDFRRWLFKCDLEGKDPEELSSPHQLFNLYKEERKTLVFW